MGSVPSEIGVFFGKVNKGSDGWYWTDASTRRTRTAAYTGPFDTKEKAIENAVQCLAPRQTPNDQPTVGRPSLVSSSELITQRPVLPRSRRPGRRLDFWTRVRAECSTLLAMRS
jgi:hypothetical protein